MSSFAVRQVSGSDVYYGGVGMDTGMQSMNGDPVSAMAAYLLFVGTAISVFYLYRSMKSDGSEAGITDFTSMALLLSQVALTWLLFWSGEVF